MRGLAVKLMKSKVLGYHKIEPTSGRLLGQPKRDGPVSRTVACACLRRQGYVSNVRFPPIAEH
jgi:hypothetical protein